MDELFRTAISCLLRILRDSLVACLTQLDMLRSWLFKLCQGSLQL